MSRLVRFILIACALCSFALSHPLGVAAGEPIPGGASPERMTRAPLACDPDGTQASGAIYRICMPTLVPWNGDLVVYAHGYVSPTEPVGIPEDQMTLPGGLPVAFVVTSMGYGFATTSYSTNGLAVLEGMADLVDVVDVFAAKKGEPRRVYLAGVSEGGLITARTVEQHGSVFDGALAMCGPYGDFAHQINHMGDFRVLFDYFFPGLMPGDVVAIPDELITDWDDHWTMTILPQIQNPANAEEVEQLLAVARTPPDPANPSTQEEIIERLLWYNVFATNDAKAKLGGQPFDNRDRVYAGSLDDAQLNQGVARFDAEQAALDAIEAGYQTTGQIPIPLVTLHTTGDPVVPYWHATLYREKILTAGNGDRHEHFEVVRYGHCSFTTTEVRSAFARLEEMVDHSEPPRLLYLPFVPRGQ